MRKLSTILLLLFISEVSFALKGKDTTVYKNIDTMCIENCRNLLNTRFVIAGRSNKFSITNYGTKESLEYKINSNTNIGIGLSYKGIGIEFQVSPKFLNRDDKLYGKSQQFSIATSANSRRFIYDFFLRVNQGFHTTKGTPVPGDTTGAVTYFYRPDITNTNLGGEFVYVFNNKRFSSSAPYNFTQRQKRSEGSALLGTFFSLYGINADSVIFPDSLKDRFKPEVQFRRATTLTSGISYGYTYTFILWKYWFINLYTLPGLSIHQYYSTNAYSEETKSSVSLGLTFQYRFSIGLNRPKYFFGISAVGNNYSINNNKSSTLSYQYGSVRAYYGYRFALKKEYLKRM
ncbi:MAG: DUF4421 family protein [Bacteroidota bacterium]